MKRLNRNQRNYLIIGLCAILLVMAVGYAAFSSLLTINGTSEVTSNWDVKITDVKPDKIATKTGNNYTTSGSVTHTPNELNGDDPSLTATFSAALISPGDTVTYDVTIKNLGSLKAKLDKINENLAAGSSEYIEYEITGAKAGKTVLAPKNDESGLDVTHLYVKVKYKDIPEGQGQPNITTWGLTITLDFSQTIDEPSSGILTPSQETLTKLNQTPTTSGDGIYQEGDRYVYKGASPSNYIRFNNETWRIMSIESDGTLKIIRDERLDTTGRVFDSKNLRDSGSKGAGGTYCTAKCSSGCSSGCNAWVSTANMLGTPSTFTNNIQSGTVLLDSELSQYLNGDYLQTITTNKDKIVRSTFNIGSPGFLGSTNYTTPNNTISETQALEDDYQWNGAVGLITASEYMNANTNASCLTMLDLKSNSSICKSTNYLFKNYRWWFLSPNGGNSYYKNTSSVFMAGDSGEVSALYASGDNNVRPVIHLSKDTKLTGNGGSNTSDMFKIIN